MNESVRPNTEFKVALLLIVVANVLFHLQSLRWTDGWMDERRDGWLDGWVSE